MFEESKSNVWPTTNSWQYPEPSVTPVSPPGWTPNDYCIQPNAYDNLNWALLEVLQKQITELRKEVDELKAANISEPTEEDSRAETLAAWLIEEEERKAKIRQRILDYADSFDIDVEINFP